MGSVPFKQGLMIKSREDASLQSNLRAGNMGNGNSEKRKSTLEGKKKFRRVFQEAEEFQLVFKRCVQELWVSMMIEGEKVGLSKEPEFSSGEAVELSRDALFDLLFRVKLQKEIHNVHSDGVAILVSYSGMWAFLDL